MYNAGAVTIFQYGAGQAGVMRTLGKYMVASGGMFGYVLLIQQRRSLTWTAFSWELAASSEQTRQSCTHTYGRDLDTQLLYISEGRRPTSSDKLLMLAQCHLYCI
jgi:Reactive mitochondrial oxygen species modulator 1